ncbi:MAG TPA: element excision factor XisH family protein [Chloroflexaceae bacterium]|nr:element excision factor XisH family protein [Chloroflexaceae bacterium]
MPARDVYHNAVKAALIADGWTITAEDYTIPVGLQRVYIDLQAERELITAQQGNQKIAVEVKSFIGASTVKDLRDAIGQYIMYRSVLSRLDPGRVPYLAIDSETAQTTFVEPLAEYLVTDQQVLLVIVDIAAERIVEWRS